MIQLPIRLDRIQTALFEMVRDEITPSAGWGYGEPSFGEEMPRDHVLLTMVSGPAPGNRQRRRGTLLNPASEITIRVTSAAPGPLALVRLNGFDSGTNVAGPDTLSDVRDRLQALVEAAGESLTVSTVGADAFKLEATFPGALRSLELFGPLAFSDLVIDDQSVLVIEGSQDMLISVGCFSKGKEPFDGAWALSARIIAALQTEDIVEKLRAFGIGVRDRGTPTDLSALAGGRWETRTSLDLIVSALAVWTRPVGRIETTKVIQTTNDLDQEIETSTFTVQAPPAP